MLSCSARHLIAIAALLPGATAATDRFASISSGWEYRLTSGDAWHNRSHLDRAQLRNNPGLWLRHKIPDIGARNTDLIFIGFAPRVSVYADTALLYDYNHSTHAATVHVIPLPPAGKEIEIWIPRVEFGSLGIEDPYVAASESVAAVIQRLVNDLLRRDLPTVVIGFLTVAAGFAMLTLFLVRRRAQNLAWLYLGAASLLYGARLLMDSAWISFVIGYPAEFWRWAIAFITYTIGIPSILLARNALGPGWKSSLTWVLRIQLAFSIVAVGSDLVQGIPMSVNRLNAAWALLFTLIILANVLRTGSRTVPGRNALAVGVAVFVLTVVNTNLAELGLYDWRPWALQLEPYGFLVLLASFAYFVVRQAFTTEEKLLAVEHELDTARRIQESILPNKLPSISGLEIAARYIPMTAVAGDFYDFVQIDDDRLGILVADVSGHGVPAALVASMVKIAFAGQSDRAADPAGVLRGMNEILHGRVQRQFVTAVYAFIDTAQGSIVYASAGHPPALLRHAGTNAIEPLNQGGLVLGPFRKTSYTNHRVSFEPGDRLLLYTDGILEAANSAEEFYGDRSFQVFMTRDKSSAERFTDELVQDVRRWSPSQADDLTVVTVDHVGRLARLAITA